MIFRRNGANLQNDHPLSAFINALIKTLVRQFACSKFIIQDISASEARLVVQRINSPLQGNLLQGPHRLIPEAFLEWNAVLCLKIPSDAASPRIPEKDKGASFGPLAATSTVGERKT